jgi:hypothetical protein
MTEVFNNTLPNLPITFSAPCGAGDASIQVNNASVLSATGNFRLVCVSVGGTEIMLGTSRSGAVVSVSRAQEGTTAIAHAIGDLIYAALTAGALEQLKADAIAGAPGSIAIVSITSPGTYTAAANTHYYVNLGTAGGNVTLTTASIGSGQSFSVKLIGSLGGFTCTISPITAGSHIESLSSPGTLTTSMVLNVLGEEVTLESPDGTNLYY